MRSNAIVGSLRALSAQYCLALSALLIGLAAPTGAFAQVIERINVQRVGDEAEVSIRFVSPVQYQRHSPPGRGNALNIYFQLQQPDTNSPTLVPETATVPRGELEAGLMVHYPEPDSSMLIRFTDATAYRVRQGRDNQSINIYVPVRLSAAGEKALPVAEFESKARDDLAKARAALGRGDSVAAVDILNSLLNLPPNSTSPEAQELMGLARERNGEMAKARAEYELYLKLYPEGPAAASVQARITKLAAVPAADVASARPIRRQEDTGWQVTGGFSQYRYQGKSDTVTEPPRVIVCTPTTDRNTLPPNTICGDTAAQNQLNGQTLARTDQNSLISNLDFMARRRTESTDSRFVLRDVNTIYYLNRPNINRLNALYYEHSNRDLGYMARVGRQTGNGGGVLGRFDGALVGYSVTPTWRLNAVGGDMVEFNSPYKKNFYGASLDMQPKAESIGGSIFAIEQRSGGTLDRQAIGMEARYFDNTQNIYGLLDYDTSFGALNIAMLQINWTGSAGTNYYLMADHRRTPLLMLTSAVDTQYGTGATISQFDDKSYRDDIARITPMANTIALGLMHPLTEKWQVGGDIQVSNLGSTVASQKLLQDSLPIAGFQGTGNTFLYTARGIGNNIILSNDMLVLSGTYIDAGHTMGATTYTAQSLSATHIARPSDSLQFDTTLRYYSQSRSDGEKLTRLIPVLKVLYRIRNNLSFEAEMNIEQEKTSNGANPGSATRHYYYAGYRWDFM